MKAIFKREVRSYFSSPVGYVCVAALMALYGWWYYQAMLTSSSSYITSVFGTMFTFSMMIIPIITMRSMTDDQKNKTDQALLTAPVGVTSIVLGKFFACCFVYFVATTLGGILPAVVMSFFSTPAWGEIIGNYIGTLLYGAAMIAIGVFIQPDGQPDYCRHWHLCGVHCADVHGFPGLRRFQSGDQHGDSVAVLLRPVQHLYPGHVQHFQRDLLYQRVRRVCLSHRP